MKHRSLLALSVMAALIGPASSLALAAEPTSADSDFVMKAAQGNLAEIKAGELAKTHSKDPEVQKVGEKLVHDHEQANSKLKPIAEAQKITFPTMTDTKHQELAKKLESLKGPEFDKVFLSHLTQDHEKTATLYKMEIKDTADAPLKQYATSVLPVVEKHLSMLEKTK